ncbi:MAG: ferrous iron transporter B [Luminiphilus sp.]|jgi:ferrous iron transport protein B|nr:ferrous iron transporter B [Luminiphilus sp.]
MSSVLLVGTPNSGKTALFNRLTGLNHRVANYPGITVDLSVGRFAKLSDHDLIDFPGTYSLKPISEEERVAVAQFARSLVDPAVTHVLCVVDATRLEKSLFLCLQVISECRRRGRPVTVLANMGDILKRHALEVDAEGLAGALNAPVMVVSARTGEGLDQVISHLEEAIQNDLQVWIEPASNLLAQDDDSADERLYRESHRLAARYGAPVEKLLQVQSRLDRFFLGSVSGGLAFWFIMLTLFQSIFTWSAPAMDAVEKSVAALGQWLLPLVEHGIARDFLADAVFSGIGAFLVFVPQIFVLTFIIGLLEDSGYLARAALICHKPLHFFGLSGKSFIPMLSGVACAIPAIYAARSIESPRARFLTYLAIPLMPCSARLPVYALLIAIFIPRETALGGLVGLQGLTLFAIYSLGMVAGLLVAGVVNRLSVPLEQVPFMMELPAYRLPALIPIARKSIQRAKHFVTKAGLVILTVTIVVWILGYFPNYGADLGESWLGMVGKWIEPVFQPLGLDWRYGVAIVSAFLAREVFVGTLGTIMGIEGAEDNIIPLVEQVQATGLPIGSGFALLVFFAIALQCVSTVAILAKEAQSWGLAVRMVVAYLCLAWLAAWVTFQLTALI